MKNFKAKAYYEYGDYETSFSRPEVAALAANSKIIIMWWYILFIDKQNIQYHIDLTDDLIDIIFPYL